MSNEAHAKPEKKMTNSRYIPEHSDVFPTNRTFCELPLADNADGDFFEPEIRLEGNEAKEKFEMAKIIAEYNFPQNQNESGTIYLAYGTIAARPEDSMFKYCRHAIVFRRFKDADGEYSKAVLFQVNSVDPIYSNLAEDAAREYFEKALGAISTQTTNPFASLRNVYIALKRHYWENGRDWRLLEEFKNNLKPVHTYKLWVESIRPTDNEKNWYGYCPICEQQVGLYGPGYDLMCGNGDCISFDLPGHPSIKRSDFFTS